MSGLRFLHIPKTAGITLFGILRRQYPRKAYFTFSGDAATDIERFRSLPQDQRENIVLWVGHAPIKTGISQADSATVITLLRDPVSRVKSFCQHVFEGKSPHLRCDFPPESFDLGRFLDSGNPELSNLQTKMLINTQDCSRHLSFQEMPPLEAKDRALENLFDNVLSFGLQEHFDESLMLFTELLNWRVPVYDLRNMRSVARVLQFEQHHLDRISELNALDIEVYTAAKPRFLASLEANGINEAKLRRFRLIQRAASPLIARIARIWAKITKN